MKFQTIFAFAVCITLAVIADQARAENDEALVAEITESVTKNVAKECSTNLRSEIRKAAAYTVERLKGKKFNLDYIKGMFSSGAKFFTNIASAHSKCRKEIKAALLGAAKAKMG